MAAVRKTPTSNKPAKQQFAILSSRILNMMVINIVIIQKIKNIVLNLWELNLKTMHAQKRQKIVLFSSKFQIGILNPFSIYKFDFQDNLSPMVMCNGVKHITQPEHPFSEHGADYSKGLGGGIKKTAGGCFRLRVGYLGCKFKPERQVAGHKKSKIGNIILFKISS